VLMLRYDFLNTLAPFILRTDLGLKGEEDSTLLTTSPENAILDSLAAKSWAIRQASDAAVSVLRVDSIIMSKPAGGPKIPQQSGNWDED
jgi:chaperonin GroEL (HSP60 family)